MLDNVTAERKRKEAEGWDPDLRLLDDSTSYSNTSENSVAHAPGTKVTPGSRKKVCVKRVVKLVPTPPVTPQAVTAACGNLEGFGRPGELPADQALFGCLVCGKSECGFDRGVTIMKEEDGQSKEHDELEDMPAVFVRDQNCEAALDEESRAVRECVRGVLQSKTFFSSNKYVGNSHEFHKKLKLWLEARLHSTTIVGRNWLALRRAAKETLRYKRQVCISRMQQLFVGALLVVASDRVVCFASSRMPPHITTFDPSLLTVLPRRGGPHGNQSGTKTFSPIQPRPSRLRPSPCHHLLGLGGARLCPLCGHWRGLSLD